MRHAAGQHADGFHFLRLAQLLFQLPVPGHIHQHRQLRRLAAVFNGVLRHLHVDDAAAGITMAARIAARRRSFPGYQHPVEAHAAELLPRVAVERRSCRVGFQNPPRFGIHDPHGLGMLFE